MGRQALVFDGGPPDAFGRHAFSIFWIGPCGFRAQYFHAVASGYVARGAVVFRTEEEAEAFICGRTRSLQERVASYLGWPMEKIRRTPFRELRKLVRSPKLKAALAAEACKQPVKMSGRESP